MRTVTAEVRWWLAGAVLLVAMAVPVVLDHDDFPLSTYPMYSSARPREVGLVVAVGVDERGERRALGLGTIGRSDDPLVVAGELRSAVAAGRAGDRCEEIAARVAAGSGARRLVAVEVATERHDVVAGAEGEPSMRSREVHARCEVPPP